MSRYNPTVCSFDKNNGSWEEKECYGACTAGKMQLIERVPKKAW